MKYKKYFSILVLLLVLMFLTSYLKELKNYLIQVVIIDQSVKSKYDLAEIIVNDIWNKQPSKIHPINIRTIVELRMEEDFATLYKEIERSLNSLSPIQINMYNAKAEKVFSNSEKVELSEFSELQKNRLEYFNHFHTSMNANSGSFYIDKKEFYSKIRVGSKATNNEVDIKMDLLHTLIPVFLEGSSDKELIGIVEFFDDVGKEYLIISYGEKFALALMILILLLYIITVFYYSFQAQKIVTIQYELNREHEEAKFKAEEESQKKSQFLANVSHELRTPLNSIIGFSEIIANEALGPIGDPKYQEYGKDINSSGNHLLSLINDILDFSKAEAEKLVVEAIEIDLSKIALNSLKMVQSRAENGSVTLRTKLPESHVIMIADPKRIKQILLNLLSNAVKFTPEGGEVSLSVYIENDQIIIKVTDNGIGIAEKDISRALSVFGQVDNKLSRKYEGTGLGLPLTKRLVELMGGSFELTSAEGFGTTATLKFAYNNSIQNS